MARWGALRSRAAYPLHVCPLCRHPAPLLANAACSALPCALPLRCAEASRLADSILGVGVALELAQVAYLATAFLLLAS